MAYKTKKFGLERKRRDFSKVSGSLDLPDLVEIQTDSFEWLMRDGLETVFTDVYPIKSHNEELELQYKGSFLKEPKFTVTECKDNSTTYSQPLYAHLRLINGKTGEIKEQEVFFGDFPMMTPKGTFIVNGSERVIISQLVRSPGTYFKQERDKSGQMLFKGSLIPTRGAWLEYESDTKEVLNVRVDKTRKLPATTLLQSFGLSLTAQKNLFGQSKMLMNTLDKDGIADKSDALMEVYNKLRPGEPATINGAKSLLVAKFFDPRRYDLASAGRYKLNKKLAVADRIHGMYLSEPIIDIKGKIVLKADTLLEGANFEKASAALAKGANTIQLKTDLEFGSDNKIQFVKVYKEEDKKSDIIRVVGNHPTLTAKHVTVSDIVASFSYLVNLTLGVGRFDDIDHLGNRRVRASGELIQNQFRIGIARIERVVKEKMSTTDTESVTPKKITNVRPLTAAIREFFASSQLSQFMDQMNPLSELANKRRLSALGPGGLSRDRAGFEVRDVHFSHYGRMCPIETPEGPNIGLINNLATYAKINEYGFIQTPYRTVTKTAGKVPVVTDKTVYLTADEEFNLAIAQANISVDAEGKIKDKDVNARLRGENVIIPREEIDYVDVSPKQIVSIASACIPFLENDDAIRAAMGANMQRQAVPLVKPQAPLIGTGVEGIAARYSGMALVATGSGTVEYVDSNKIIVKEKSDTKTYKLIKFTISNQSTVINQTPIVTKGMKIKAGDIIADGPSMDGGELALGQNVTVAFMTWNGYNYEDAIIMSERMVKDDVYTSIHLKEYTIECRDTKLGDESITAELPNVSDVAKKYLDGRGIIVIGAEVKEGDILVGKVTPKGQVDMSPEEKLLMAIFGDKSKNVRDSSLRIPHGGDGIVQAVKVFRREDGHKLSPGVNEIIKVYVIQKRKIKEGDKMAGRHGNKGVISKILPIEDMPSLPDGTPVDIMLNPLGVPSRMNIGQVLELHLGMAAKKLGVYVASPVFDGANNDELMDMISEAGMAEDAKVQLRDGMTGENFDERTSVGVMYMVKLSHMVDDKLHARSIGPYSLITQQPLGGKAQKGGQRFGEMEVWALEAYGAAHTLQEILTVKSDDINGRTKIYDAIVRNRDFPEAGIPESFRVLQKELQSLAINVKLMENGTEVNMQEAEKADRAELVTAEDK